MSKVTSKLQLTVPKAITDQYGIRPGDELQWVPAGDSIRVIPGRKGRRVQGRLTLDERLFHIKVLLEFVAVLTRTRPGVKPLLEPADARREAEEFLPEFTVLY